MLPINTGVQFCRRASCQHSAVQQRSTRGHGWAAVLPEDCHGAGKASGSVKSCIDQTVLRTGSSELAGLKGRERNSGLGRCLPCWMWLWSLRRSRLLHRKGTHPWAGSLVAWSHPRERRKGLAERAPGGKGGLDTWQMVQLAPCPLAGLHQGLLPLVSQHTHWATLALALPRSPSCLGTSPGPSNSSRLSQGSMLREKQGPHPQSTSSFPGSS